MYMYAYKLKVTNFKTEHIKSRNTKIAFSVNFFNQRCAVKARPFVDLSGAFQKSRICSSVVDTFQILCFSKNKIFSH